MTQNSSQKTEPKFDLFVSFFNANDDQPTFIIFKGSEKILSRDYKHHYSVIIRKSTQTMCNCQKKHSDSPFCK